MARRSIQERFDEKYIPEPISGCWLWTAHCQPNGYGAIERYDGKSLLAHRVSWELHHGPIPKGLHVCHKCDVCCCVNPQHLFLGTHADNMADAVRKGRKRMPTGDASPHTKLPDADVGTIRTSSEMGIVLAKRFNVSPGYISSIRNGKKRVQAANTRGLR